MIIRTRSKPPQERKGTKHVGGKRMGIKKFRERNSRLEMYQRNLLKRVKKKGRLSVTHTEVRNPA